MTSDETGVFDTNYTWGLVLQGMTKKKRRRKKEKVSEASKDEKDTAEAKPEKNWWSYMREEVVAGVRFPTIDQPVVEALCVLADLDTWHVGILSNNAPWQSPPLPIGMSRLVSNMLESFAYVWRKYHSPIHVSSFSRSIRSRSSFLSSKAFLEKKNRKKKEKQFSRREFHISNRCFPVRGNFGG